MTDTDLLDYRVNSRGKNIVFAFASGPMDRFEWGRTLDALDVSYVLLRDRSGRWYQDGIAGIGTFAKTQKWMYELARQHGRSIAIGLSSGAYGALFWGYAAKLDEVVAISPVTGKGERVAGDFPDEYRERLLLPEGHPKIVDLAAFYTNRDEALPRVRAFISDGDGTEIDRRMAERILSPSIVTVPGYSHGGLAKGLRDRGWIAQIVGEGKP